MGFTVEKYVRIIAGSFVLISLVLGLTVSRWWFVWTALVGVNLIQSAFTNWCIAETIIKKFGVK